MCIIWASKYKYLDKRILLFHIQVKSWFKSSGVKPSEVNISQKIDNTKNVQLENGCFSHHSHRNSGKTTMTFEISVRSTGLFGQSMP